MKPNKEATVLASWLGTIGRALTARGIAPAPVFAAAGLDYALCSDPDARFPFPQTVNLWQLAVDACGDRNFPLEIPRFVQPLTIHSLGLGLLASSTATDGLKRLERYSRVVNDKSYVIVDISSPDEVILELALSHENGGSPYGCESLFAMVAYFSDLVRGGAHPQARTRVEFAHPPPPDTRPFEAYFRCAVVFDAPRYRIYFDRSRCDLRMPHANPQLASLNDKAAIEYLARIENGTLADRVQAALIRMLPSGEPSRDAVARSLNLSVRTLLRRLGEEQTTFRLILDQLRRDLSEQHLRTTKLNPQQIAYLLGFNDQSSFIRAFKRWHQLSPTVWRKTSMAADDQARQAP